ncbi:MAG: response regulator [Verrucomicrobiota bacterium]
MKKIIAFIIFCFLVSCSNDDGGNNSPSKDDAGVNGNSNTEDVIFTANYDCILMDCQMPEMDGLEATESIRKLGVQITTGDDIPIVAMTACVVDEEIKRCYEVGMNDYLSKPSTPSEISSVLSKWIPQKSENLSI